MDTELERLRRLLAQQQIRAEAAENLAREERRRREEAENLNRPLTIEPYLEACHALGLAIQVVTDPLTTTQGGATDPVGRIYPRRIVPWDDFPRRQEEIWELLSEPAFAAHPAFPSQDRVNYVRSLIEPISSEQDLRHFERDTVENAVRILMGAVYNNPVLRDRLGVQGVVTFESHTNLGPVDSKPLQPVSPADGPENASTAAAPPTTPARRPHRPAGGRGKGNRADQFCIYRKSDSSNIPAMAIEYKAPHKLSRDEVVTGLASKILPDRDVINQDGDGFVFASKRLAAAVVTQLFSYMIGKGIQYGYVCTGETFVFLHIPDDPAEVRYHVCVPNLDVLDDDENRLHRTAVAQVLAFVLQALRSAPPVQEWHDKTASLDVWAVEYDDVLSRIPETVRKDKKSASAYRPQRWQGFRRSPIRTRSYCNQSAQRFRDDDDAPPSPTAGRSARSGGKAAASNTGSGQERGRRGEEQQRGKAQGIQDRPYCTHQCLFGLAHDKPIDPTCPNAPSHGSGHIGLAEFLRLLRTQLATDRGADADATPLWISGAVGSLFKLRLSAYGYTLVAKGVEATCLERLRHEKKMYDRLRPIQGKHVPVCLGLLDPELPFYCDGGVYEHLLLLSWAGRPLHRCIDQVGKPLAAASVNAAFTALHRLGVLHGDAAMRNILYDRTPMIVDFERSKLCTRQPLGPVSPNSQRRKRKHGTSPKEKDDFARELESVLHSVSR